MVIGDVRGIQCSECDHTRGGNLVREGVLESKGLEGRVPSEQSWEQGISIMPLLWC